MGKVLRVRKPPKKQTCTDVACCSAAAAAVALERAVWRPVVGDRFDACEGRAGGCWLAAWEQAGGYIDEVMAPLLGRRFIPPSQPVHPSTAFVAALLQRGGCAQPGGGGDEAVAASMPLAAALLPDVTLMPVSGCGHGIAVGNEAAAAERQGPGGDSGSGISREPPSSPPVVCFELKPKCGFVTACGTVHPERRALKHSRPRYRLHQHLKLQQVCAPSRRPPRAHRLAVTGHVLPSAASDEYRRLPPAAPDDCCFHLLPLPLLAAGQHLRPPQRL